MRVAITGATGLVGRALARALGGAGHRVLPVTRRRDVARRVPGVSADATILWRPDRAEITAAPLEGTDAAIHLAGASLMGPWTRGKKRRIRKSRINGTALLARTLARLERPPRTLLSASAVGYYGDQPPNRVVNEEDGGGTGFLADVAREWEAATQPAERAGIRVVHMRFGVVLSPNGGMLGIMQPLFRWGLGGRVGSGSAPLSWIALADVVGAVEHVLGLSGTRPEAALSGTTPGSKLSGPVNFTAPESTTHAEFGHTLATVLRRPLFLRLPAFAARLATGGMADEMLLGGARVAPTRLERSGYPFQFVDLESALRAMIN